MSQLLIILSFLFILNSCSQTKELKINEIQDFANHLLISKAYTAKIQSVLPIIDNIQVVVLEMPYREFPNIILIKKDDKTNNWKRTFECLNPGIQDEQSGLFDWHTKGCGVDLILNKDTTYYFQSTLVREFIESTLDKKGGVIIPYENFIHINTSDSTEQKDFEPYTIDKTSYFDFANELMDNKYNSYPKNQCIMFDSPKIIDCKFIKEQGLYRIYVITDNSQKWIYEFTGIDDNNRNLLNKRIKVEKAR